MALQQVIKREYEKMENQKQHLHEEHLEGVCPPAALYQ